MEANTDNGELVGSRLYDLRATKTHVSYSTAGLYRLMAAGKFPKPKRIGAKSVRWLGADILAWIEGLKAE